MYRRLVVFALLVVAVAATALVIPLALSARDIVRAGNLAVLAEESRLVADSWEALARTSTSGTGHEESEDRTAPVIDLPGEPGEVLLIYPDATVVGGTVPDSAQALVASAQDGRSASTDSGGAGYAAAPATFSEESVGVVLVVGDSARMNTGLVTRWVALAVLCAVLLAGAAVAAWLLARRTVRPILELAGTADALAAGDLSAHAQTSGISEIDDVAVALNRLSGRVQELLEEERAAASELAHQLRTPLTVLAADVDAVADPVIRERLADDVLTLQRTTDEIINSARRTSREGLRPTCDAVAVVAQRAQFWAVLAEFQGRRMVTQGTSGPPLPVRLTEYDLTTAVDILLQNVFTHTDEGTGLDLLVRTSRAGLVDVTVRDDGPGFAEEPTATDRPGSTGLGLAIAERLAQASGGTLLRGASPSGGAEVTLRLGAAEQ